MRAFIILFLVTISAVGLAYLNGWNKSRKEAGYAREMVQIMERNQSQFEAYAVLARKFVWSDCFLVSCMSADNFERVSADECKDLVERIALLNRIAGSVEVRDGYRWKNADLQREYAKAYGHNAELVATAMQLRQSAEKLQACLSQESV